jgi:uncharacterized tellurite resistance protein B-like protein
MHWSLQQFFAERISLLVGGKNESDVEHFEVTAEERHKLEVLVRETLALDENETRELLAAAEREVESSVELFQFTRLIDEAFTPEQKAKVVERLWRIAYADQNVDRLEEHLVRKIANLLHVSHRDYIAAKLAAKTG